MRPSARSSLVLVIALALGTACAQGDEIEPDMGTFGDPTMPATTTPPATSSSSSTSASATTASSSGTSGDAADSSEGSASAGASSGSDSGSTSEGGSSSSGTPSEQPLEGMYSDCESAVECFGLTLCMTIEDDAGLTIDGYCTRTSCVGPSDCDPAPAGTGTATAGCFPVTIADAMESVCALSCDAGKVCPAGMECYEVSGGSICA